MANIFLDSNQVFDLTIRNPALSDHLSNHFVYASPLSIHILFYTEKIKIPSKTMNDSLDRITFVMFDSSVLKMALLGPTKDLEDNIQLQSASKVNCDIFLTNDKKLLKLGNFGKVKISPAI